MMCMGCTPGIWKHPRDGSGGYNTLKYWTDLAQLLERGKFDSIFIADIFGVYDIYQGGAASAFTHAVEFPVCDPMMVLGVGGFAPIEVGSPATIADAMEDWMRETGIDGFNLIYSVTPGDFADVVEMVVPELQRRGIYKTEYAPWTLRKKLYGKGRNGLAADQPGAAYRGAGRIKKRE